MPKQLPNYQEFDVESLRPFSKIRLVAIDLDGTLLESNDSDIPEKVLELARSLKNWRYGVVRITIATGRTLSGARLLLDKLPILNDTPIILYNGSLILDRKYQVIRRDVIPPDAVTRIIKLSSEFDVKVMAYIYDCIGLNGQNEHALGWSYNDRPSLDYNKMPIKWMEWGEFEWPTPPSAMVIHTFEQKEVVNRLTKALRKIKEISCTLGGTAYIEVRPKLVNKATALKYAAEILKIGQIEVLAIGDNDNDAEMLSWAGIGVAVESASSLALKSSKYCAPRGVMEGAIQALQLVRDAKRFIVNDSF